MRYYKVITTIEGLDCTGEKVEIITTVMVRLERYSQLKTVCKYKNIEIKAAFEATPKETLEFKGLKFF